MSYEIVREFPLATACAAEFEKACGPHGGLGAVVPASTRLHRDPTVDRWDSRKAFDNFRPRFANEYSALDTKSEDLASLERRLGRSRD